MESARSNYPLQDLDELLLRTFNAHDPQVAVGRPQILVAPESQPPMFHPQNSNKLNNNNKTSALPHDLKPAHLGLPSF
jgi:hypothetical protein